MFARLFAAFFTAHLALRDASQRARARDGVTLVEHVAALEVLLRNGDGRPIQLCAMDKDESSMPTGLESACSFDPAVNVGPQQRSHTGSPGSFIPPRRRALSVIKAAAAEARLEFAEYIYPKGVKQTRAWSFTQ